MGMWRRPILMVSTIMMLSSALPAQAAPVMGGIGGGQVMVLAAAQAAGSHQTTPLIIVRFNQRSVYYQQPLYNAVSRAMQVKPGVRFNVVSVVPVAGDADTDSQLQDVARANTGRLMQDMLQMGVPQNQLTVSYQTSAAVETNEVHIFVQ